MWIIVAIIGKTPVIRDRADSRRVTPASRAAGPPGVSSGIQTNRWSCPGGLWRAAPCRCRTDNPTTAGWTRWSRQSPISPSMPKKNPVRINGSCLKIISSITDHIPVNIVAMVWKFCHIVNRSYNVIVAAKKFWTCRTVPPWLRSPVEKLIPWQSKKKIYK